MIRIKNKLDTLLILDSDPYREERYNPELWPKNPLNNRFLHFIDCYWDDVNKCAKAITPELFLEEKKVFKKQNIVVYFDNEIFNGKFQSTILGIEVDCRRSTTKNDLQNCQGLISFMTRNNIPQIEYKGYTESVIATISDLQTLCNEMEDHVLGLYTKKWLKESEIDACQTVDELEQITW